MADFDKTVPVLCCVFCDGTVVWTLDIENGPAIESKIWRDLQTVSEYVPRQKAGGMNGFVVVKMLPEDVQKLNLNSSGVSRSALNTL